MRSGLLIDVTQSINIHKRQNSSSGRGFDRLWTGPKLT